MKFERSYCDANFGECAFCKDINCALLTSVSGDFRHKTDECGMDIWRLITLHSIIKLQTLTSSVDDSNGRYKD